MGSNTAVVKISHVGGNRYFSKDLLQQVITKIKERKVWAMLKLDKVKFMKTEVGSELDACIKTRTDDYFGLVTEDETDWLMKIER